MHCKGMNFTDFLLHCKSAILKADFSAAHTVSRQTQCPPGGLVDEVNQKSARERITTIYVKVKFELQKFKFHLITES